MDVTALKSFPFSRDGITIEHAVEGTTVNIPDDILIGLHGSGHIAFPGESVEHKPVEVKIIDNRSDTTEQNVTFDPTTATVEELRAHLTASGVKFHYKAGIDKLRELCK